jgi:hypothetical protein
MVQHKTPVVAYVRMSSVDQNLGRQLEAVDDVARVFEEEVSGGSRADHGGAAGGVRHSTRSRAWGVSFPGSGKADGNTRQPSPSLIKQNPTAYRGSGERALLLGGCLQGLEEPGVGIFGRGVLSEGEL